MDRSTQLKTVLGADCDLTGELNLESDALIMGTFEGRLSVSGMLDLNRTARIKGTIIAGSLRIGGRVEADVIAREKLELLEGAVVIGRIFSPRLTVASGGVLRGQVCIGPNAEEESRRVLGEAAPARAIAAQAPAEDDASETESQEEAPLPPAARTIPDSIKAVLERRQPVKPLRPNKTEEKAEQEQPVEQAA